MGELCRHMLDDKYRNRQIARKMRENFSRRQPARRWSVPIQHGFAVVYVIVPLASADSATRGWGSDRFWFRQK